MGKDKGILPQFASFPRKSKSIYAFRKRFDSHRDHDQVSHLKKQAQKIEVSDVTKIVSYPKNSSRKFPSFSYACTPCCAISSILLGLLLAMVIGAIFIAIALRNQPSTTSEYL